METAIIFLVLSGFIAYYSLSDRIEASKSKHSTPFPEYQRIRCVFVREIYSEQLHLRLSMFLPELPKKGDTVYVAFTGSDYQSMEVTSLKSHYDKNGRAIFIHCKKLGL